MSTKSPTGEYRQREHGLLGLLDRFEARLDAIMLRTWWAQAVLVVAVAVIGALVLFSPTPRPHPHLPALPALPEIPAVPSPAAIVERPVHWALDGASRLWQAHAPSTTGVRTGTGPAVLAGCPGAASVSSQVGASVGTFNDPCGFHWQGTSATVRCPSGYLCTFDLGSKIAVMIGNGQSVRINGAGTWRYTAAYPFGTAGHSPCALLTYERQYAQQHDPGIPVVADGFRCAS